MRVREEPGGSRKKLIKTDGEVQMLYYLYREHNITPGEWKRMSYGERTILRAFFSQEMDDLREAQG